MIFYDDHRIEFTWQLCAEGHMKDDGDIEAKCKSGPYNKFSARLCRNMLYAKINLDETHAVLDVV